MRIALILLLVFLILDCGKRRPPTPPPVPTATATPIPKPSPLGTPWPRLTLSQLPVSTKPSVDACVVDSGDYGMKINECQKTATEVYVTGDGQLDTSAVIEPDHMVTIGPDTTISPTTQAMPIRLKEGATLRGSGWTSIVMESTHPTQWGVVGRYYGSLANEAKDERMTIRDLKIQGVEGKPFNSAPQAIEMGNCVECVVENVWLNETHSIGLQYGGAGFAGNYALNSIARHVLFTRVASQALACVNCDQVLFENIYVIDPGHVGGPGNTSIDFEPNGPTDHNSNNILRNFYIDHRGSVQPTTGNGVVVQASATAQAGDILVEDGIVIGGRGGWESEITNKLSNALYVFGISDVTVQRVKVSRTGQTCINLDAAVNITLADILCEDVGGGGTPGFIAAVSGESVFRNILFRYTGAGPADNRLILTGAPEITNVTGWAIQKEN